MIQTIFLDSGLLGLIIHPQRSAEVLAVSEWLSRCIRGGQRVIVPAIAYYEIKRHLRLAEKAQEMERLEAFVRAKPWRYLAVSDTALKLATVLWAKARREGVPTSDAAALDIDVILAAQALSFGVRSSEFVVATAKLSSDRGHLAQFVDARAWEQIVPSDLTRGEQ